MKTISNELKRTIAREVEALWKHRCDAATTTGFGRSYGCPRERYDMYKMGIRFGERDVTWDGEVIAKVHRRYAQRKVNLYYRELKPTIEWVNAA